MKRLFLAAALLALVAAPVLAQDAPKNVDVTGTWEMTVESPQGSMTITVEFKQDGEKLTGKQVSEMGEAPLTGTIKGNDLAYELTVDMGGQQMKIVNKGKVEGDVIKGTTELGEMGSMAWTAKRKK
jgi:hypothetical protein